MSGGIGEAVNEWRIYGRRLMEGAIGEVVDCIGEFYCNAIPLCSNKLMIIY